MNLITINVNVLIKYKNSPIAKTSAMYIYEMHWNNKDRARVKAKDVPFAGKKKNGSRDYLKYILSVFFSN